MTYKKRKYQHVKLIQLSKELQHKILYSMVLKGIPRFSSPTTSITATKNSHLKNRLKTITPVGKALCLLKTQFAKKPKNPV